MPLPGRVDAAMQFVRHADILRNPPPGFEGMRQEPRELTAVEQRVEDAALAVLLDYFECKADFGDDPPRLSMDTKSSPEVTATAVKVG